MENEDSYARGLELFFQQINQKIKEDPDYQIEDLEKEIGEWAICCGFSSRKFLEYYKNNVQRSDPDTGSGTDI